MELPELHTILRASGYLGLISICGAAGTLFGGLPVLTVSSTFAVPWLGAVARFLLNGRVKAIVLVKLFSWCVSSGGLIFGYYLCQSFWGRPETALEWIGVGIPGLVTAINVISRVVLFDMIDTEEIFKFTVENTPRWLTARLSFLDDGELVTLTRRNFADMNFTLILRVLAASGVLIFSLANLGFLGAKEPLPDLSESLVSALSLSGLGPSPPEDLFSGLTWILLRFVVGLTLLVWAVVFIAFAMGSLPDAARLRSILNSGGVDPLPEEVDVTVSSSTLEPKESSGRPEEKPTGVKRPKRKPRPKSDLVD